MSVIPDLKCEKIHATAFERELKVIRMDAQTAAHRSLARRIPARARARQSNYAAGVAARECLPRRTATISARIEIAISSGVIAPRSSPAGALSLARRSAETSRAP